MQFIGKLQAIPRGDNRASRLPARVQRPRDSGKTYDGPYALLRKKADARDARSGLRKIFVYLRNRQFVSLSVHRQIHLPARSGPTALRNASQPEKQDSRGRPLGRDRNRKEII